MTCAAAAALLFLAAPAGAAESRSAGHVLARQAPASGGASQMGSANHRLVIGIDEDVGGSTMSSANHRLGPGYAQIFTTPGAIGGLTHLGDVSLSSVTLQWTAPGLDGALGALTLGSSYYIRVASYTAPGTFADIRHANVVFSTQGVAGAGPGAVVSSKPAVFLPNTTWYYAVWAADAHGNVGYPSVGRATFTTMALPIPSLMAEAFPSIQDSTVTVAWNKLNDAPPDASSMTAAGYILEVSSTNFGTLFPGGVVNSSVAWHVAASTLTVAFPDPAVTTNYYRVGSLNWEGRPNWLQLGKMNFQITPSAAFIAAGALDMTVDIATVTTSSMVVYNVGDTSATYVVDADTDTLGAVWTLGSAPGVEVFTLQGLWNGGSVAPPHAAFSTFITSNPLTSAPANFAGGQSGVLVPPGQNRTLWFRFRIPASTAENGPQQVRVTVVPVKP